MQTVDRRPALPRAPTDTCFIQVHVPRTGGTTVREVLFELLSPKLKSDEIFLIDLDSDRFCKGTLTQLEALDSVALRRLRLVIGHAPLRFAGLVPKPLTFAVLREPVGRSLSVYWYCYHNAHHPAHEMARALSPLEFITGGWGEARNGQARYLSGYNLTTDSPTDDELLAAAEVALERLSYVGFFDRLEDVVADMCGMIGEKPPSEIPLSNAAPREPVSKRDLIRIEAYNAVDVALFKLAQERCGAKL